MTIDEAIKDCCMECTTEDSQLADWLTELKQLRQELASAAALRKAFADASAEYGRIFEGRPGRRPTVSADDRAIMNVWNKMYEACRDTTAGIELMKRLELAEKGGAPCK